MQNAREFWSLQTSSLQRFSDVNFLRKIAEEHAQVIGEDILLGAAIDLGCGAGELLYYLVDILNIKMGIDYSHSILQIASQRLKGKDIELQVADVANVLPTSSFPVWMTTAALNQYLGPDECLQLLKIFRANQDARVFYLFDCIDPARYMIFNFGSHYNNTALVMEQSSIKFRIKKIIISLISSLSLLRLMITGRSWWKINKSNMGIAYFPLFWVGMCTQLGLEVEFISSKYYEYRYHAIIRKSK